MPAYDREIYSRTFARLLEQALRKGKGDPRLALHWLQHRYKLVVALAFTRHKLETSDAYLDVREHIQKRITEQAVKMGEAEN
jgi:hypothetical protein